MSGSGLSSTTWTATTPFFGPGQRRELAVVTVGGAELLGTEYVVEGE